MSEMRKTMMFGGAALLAAAIAWMTSPTPAVPDAFLDQGEAFFPEFSDPNAATTLEVIEFDEATASATPFKVVVTDGRWSIPSHHHYPADGEDRLAQTAAGVIGITKDGYRTGNVSDHEACGVVDPLDDGATSLKGRGKRVTLRGHNDQVLADFIVGRTVEGREGYRFVRIPDQKRVYVAKMDVDLSTRFEDWIERDLLQVEKDSIEQVVLKDYSIDERTRRVDKRDVVVLDLKDGAWTADGMTAAQEIASDKIDPLLQALDDLQIVGVRPKPAGLSANLRRAEGGLSITEDALRSLQSKGYYLTRDGSLMSNEGELEARSAAGVVYTLRFGEIVYGSGKAITSGADADGAATDSPGENRYLFITTRFDEAHDPEPQAPGDRDFENRPEAEWSEADRSNQALQDAHQGWSRRTASGRRLSERLNHRFAGWYYVIAADSYDKIHLKRRDLVQPKAS